MTGNGGAFLEGPSRGRSRPPLPPSLRHGTRTVPQHAHDTLPPTDAAQALQHFATAVRDDLNDLHARFLQENVVTFAAWKRLWSDARMSAAFLVEFWESTPTTTHKMILQQALDGLVLCIEAPHQGAFAHARDVAALIGRVFALYCAYSVQVGSPKHKIDVNPQTGTALLTVNQVMARVGAKLYPIAAREGFGRRGCNQSRPLQPVAVASPPLSLPVDNATEENAPIHRSKVEQLRILNNRYQELMSRVRAGPSVSGAGLRRSNRLVPAPLLPASLHQETGTDGQDLARALTAYMEYKSNEEVRRYNRVARAAATREDESRKMLELNDSSSNILDLSDSGSVMSGSPSLMAGSVTSSRRGSRTRCNGDGIEAVLVELESDLCEDVMSDHAKPTTKHQSPQKLARGPNEKSSSTFSEISEAGSDALADLERELEQSVDIVSRQIAVPENASSHAHRERSQHAGTVSKQDASTVIPICTESPLSSAKRVRSNSVASRDSWAVSSSADNEELAAIQAELDAVPMISGPRMAEINSHCNKQSSSKVRNSTRRLPAATPKAKQAARQTSDRASDRSTKPFQHKLSSRALSVVSDSSELIAQLQAELDFSAELTSSARPSTAVVQTRPRRSSRLGSMASDTDSNTVEELEKKLKATSAAVGTTTKVSTPFIPAPVKTLRKRAASRTCTTRSYAKKLRLNDATASVKTAVRRIPAAQVSSKAKGEQRAVFSGSTAHQECSHISSVPSDTESDGLAELVAELDTPATVRTSTRVRQSRNTPAKRSNTRSIAQYQSPASSNVEASRSRTVRSVVIPDPVRLDYSARLSSHGSDTESDGIGDLMAELESDRFVANSKKSKKPRTRVATARKQPTRVLVVKSRQNQAKEGPKAARATRAAQRPVSQKVAKPSACQLPALSVNMPSSRQSTRSSSIAFDSESDGLAELEAELQA